MTTPRTKPIRVGQAILPLEIRDGCLHSLGAITVNGTPCAIPAPVSCRGSTRSKERSSAVSVWRASSNAAR